MVDATYTAKVYMTEGGDKQVVASGGAINVESGGEIQVQDVKVLDAQQSAIADSVGGDEQAKINAILAALRAHGLIAT